MKQTEQTTIAYRRTGTDLQFTGTVLRDEVDAIILHCHNNGRQHTILKSDLARGIVLTAEAALVHIVRVNFDDGDHLTTRINGTRAEVCNHYLGRSFELTDETTHKVTSVQFLDVAGFAPHHKPQRLNA